MSFLTESDYGIARFVFQRALAFVYLIAFLIAANQARPLIGEQGLLPAKLFINNNTFWESPTLFKFHFSDRALLLVASLGVLLSLFALSGFSDRWGVMTSVLVWGSLWILYLSFVNIGQVFYGFGWETLLLETGFLAIFLGPKSVPASLLVVWLFRWLLFRVMFGAGMIKLRGDECWRDLTCMYYHYQTQPLPNPLSWYFHYLPKLFHKAEVAFTHFVEIIVPIFYFFPKTLGYWAGILTIGFQFTLILSGNLSWLNYITLILAIFCFDDDFFLRFFPGLAGLRNTAPLTGLHQAVIYAVSALILFLSWQPLKNLFSRHQRMNASFGPFHLVNTYGAFGSITRERYEVILEGTDASAVGSETQWREYEFKGKPGRVDRRPSIVSPYHYKLDWQMWFAAMSDYRYHPWIINLVAKLLKNDSATLSLMGKNPFPNGAPKFVRAELYLYEYSPPGEKAWWVRKRVRSYLPPLSLDDPEFHEMLRRMHWEN